MFENKIGYYKPFTEFMEFARHAKQYILITCEK